MKIPNKIALQATYYVVKKIENITFKEEKYTLPIEEKITIQINFLPEDAGIQYFEWSYMPNDGNLLLNGIGSEIEISVLDSSAIEDNYTIYCKAIDGSNISSNINLEIVK